MKNMKLGKLIPKETKNILNIKKLTMESPAASVSRKGIIPEIEMFRNNEIGDCTSAGIANSAIMAAKLNGYDIIITTKNAVDFYAESTGYDPITNTNDSGGVEVDVLDYASKKGFKMNFDTLYPIWSTIDHKSQNDIALCIEKIGSCYLGLQLAEADQESQIWDTATPGNQTPGSWGGHCAVIWAYDGLGDEDIIYIATWGELKKATWRWLYSRIDEAHAVAFHQLANSENYNKWSQFIKENQILLSN